jgi:hypothetical protein
MSSYEVAKKGRSVLEQEDKGLHPDRLEGSWAASAFATWAPIWTRVREKRTAMVSMSKTRSPFLGALLQGMVPVCGPDALALDPRKFVTIWPLVHVRWNRFP